MIHTIVSIFLASSLYDDAISDALGAIRLLIAIALLGVARNVLKAARNADSSRGSKSKPS